MRHYSCDLCGKDLTAGADARYVVQVRVAAAPDPAELTDADLDQDQVAAMAAFLEELEVGGGAGEPAGPTALEFDLCPGCRRKFVADPFGRDAARKLRFSKN